MNKDHLTLIYQYALLLAAEEEWDQRELGPIHLLKFAYLADLTYAEHNKGSTFTGVDWKFHNFGPWSNPAHDLIEPAALGIGADKITRPSDYEGDYIRFVVKEDPEDLKRQVDAIRQKLPMELRGVLQRVVHEYKSDTKKLLHAVYATMPMLLAAPGEPLDFHSVVREPTAIYAPAEAAEPEIILSKKKQARLKSRMAELRKKCSQNYAKARAQQSKVVTQENPEELAEVTAWLDQLAGPEFPAGGATVHFTDEVWKSESRRGGTYDELSG